MFSKFKSQIIYVQIRNNALTIRSPKEKKTIKLDAKKIFSTKRLLVGEFTIAVELLTEGIHQFTNSFIAPTIIIHPIENIDEKLSEVEEKIFKELAMSAGAIKVKLWLGKELKDEELLDLN